tara:strand:+ start:5874 stop:6026 length:153 start_codon:yes stop_codon:yes gene_type:complete
MFDLGKVLFNSSFMNKTFALSLALPFSLATGGSISLWFQTFSVWHEKNAI